MALPGKVIALLDEDLALVDFNGNQVRARSGLVLPKVGDYVLVHAGCILQILDQEEAAAMTELFEELESMV